MKISAGAVAAVVVLVNSVVLVALDDGADAVKAGDCLCASTAVNAGAGLSTDELTTIPSGQCGILVGGVNLTMDDPWGYEIDYKGQRLWVKETDMSQRAASFCVSYNTTETSGGPCSGEQQQLACALLSKHVSGVLKLATRHPSGVEDSAYSYNNVRDMCDGRQASRSNYSCSTCPTGTPGGSTCLTPDLLAYLTVLVSNGTVIVNELAGACHSCRSRHYRGQAVDLHNDDRTQEYLDTCFAMRGWAQDEGNHVHCQFYD